jgi:hypothetical protein
MLQLVFIYSINDFLWASNGIQNLDRHHVVTNIIEGHNLDITNFGKKGISLKQLIPILLGEQEGF